MTDLPGKLGMQEVGLFWRVSCRYQVDLFDRRNQPSLYVVWLKILLNGRYKVVNVIKCLNHKARIKHKITYSTYSRFFACLERDVFFKYNQVCVLYKVLSFRRSMVIISISQIIYFHVYSLHQDREGITLRGHPPAP